MNVLKRCFSFPTIYGALGIIIVHFGTLAMVADPSDLSRYPWLAIKIDELLATTEAVAAVKVILVVNAIMWSLRWWHIKANTYVGCESEHLEDKFVLIPPSDNFNLFAILVPMMWILGFAAMVHLTPTRETTLGFWLELTMTIQILIVMGILIWRCFMPELVDEIKKIIKEHEDKEVV